MFVNSTIYIENDALMWIYLFNKHVLNIYFMLGSSYIFIMYILETAA